MNTAITELLDFINRKEPSSDLAKILEMFGRANIWSIAVELFGWLKRQQRFGHEKLLELRQDHRWCQELPLVLEHWPAMNELFVIEGGQLNFREGVSVDERNQIRLTVTERYQPVLRT
jgi:hypothetical protein